MLTQYADIPRYWAPLGHEVALGTHGFLRSPVFDLDRLDYTPDSHLRPTVALLNAPCLILLGAPGAGKTVELERLDSLDAEGPSPMLPLPLGEIADSEDLRHQLFEAEAFRAWREGRSDLVLSLDSLDEGRLSVDNIAALLQRHLRGGPAARLRLRITCRAADWPEGLGFHLNALFGSDRVERLTLTPLRAEDAEAIARAHLGDDAKAFLGAVVEAGVGPLATLPLSLRLLIEVFQADGRLEGGPADLFERAARHLCDELNVGRRDARRR